MVSRVGEMLAMLPVCCKTLVGAGIAAPSGAGVGVGVDNGDTVGVGEVDGDGEALAVIWETLVAVMLPVLSVPVPTTSTYSPA
jgi:hypothetical protein